MFRKGVLKNVTKLTEKCMCRILSFNRVVHWRPVTSLTWKLQYISCNEKANTLFLVINEIFAMKKCDSSALQKDQNRLIEK